MSISIPYREFFVYFGVGVMALMGFVWVYYPQVESFIYMNQEDVLYKLCTNESWILIVAFVSIGYLLGQIVGWLTLILGDNIKIEIWQKLKLKHAISDSKHNSTTDKFWLYCTRLKILNQYHLAEHWKFLNEFFHSLFVVAFILLICSIYKCNGLSILILIFIMLISYSRAQKYAIYFVKEVDNLYALNNKIDSNKS